MLTCSGHFSFSFICPTFLLPPSSFLLPPPSFLLPTVAHIEREVVATATEGNVVGVYREGLGVTTQPSLLWRRYLKWCHERVTEDGGNDSSRLRVSRLSFGMTIVQVYTVEPPNGHIGDKHFVHCSEVVPFSEVEMYGKYIGRGANCVSIVGRLSTLQSVCYWRFHCCLSTKTLVCQW